MLVKCVATLPDEDQAKKLTGSYWPGKQVFDIAVGHEYIVFGMTIINGEPWVDIEKKGSEYIVPVPLCLFQIVNGQVPSLWEVSIRDGDLLLWPSSFYKDTYYHDKLSDGDRKSTRLNSSHQIISYA